MIETIICGLLAGILTSIIQLNIEFAKYVLSKK